MAQLQAIDIPVPHGILEGLLRTPDVDPTAPARPPRMVGLVCHPHPVGGGTMHNKVVFRIAQALGDIGMPVLRFNYRGVGRSTGSFDEGRGESDDIRSALDALTERYPGAPVCLAGFSFGSWIGLPIAREDARVSQMIGVGVPVATLGVVALDDTTKHKLFVQGERDEYGPQAAIERWYAQVAPPKRLTIVPNADHFFTHEQTQLYQAIIDYFRAGVSALGIVSVQ